MTKQSHGLWAVTGVGGYTGRYVARRLLASGQSVLSLTGHPRRRSEFGAQVRSVPFAFEQPAALADSLRGVSVLVNSYWVRFEAGQATFERAVANTQTLLQAAQAAGVQRIVHVSITNPSLSSPLPYFRGKARLEEAIRAGSVPYAILRPAVIFGDEDILINNLAWLLRRFPVFPIPGDGQYRLRPIFVDDLARLIVEAGQSSENSVVDALGVEAFTFNDLVRLLRRTVGSHSLVVHVPPLVALGMSQAIGRLLGDVVLTRDELDGLLAGLLDTPSPALGQTRLSDWLREHQRSVGSRYSSELARHYQ